MPEYYVSVENSNFSINLRRTDDPKRFNVKINQNKTTVELEEFNKNKISPFTMKINGKKYHVQLEKIDRQNPFIIKINNLPFKVKLLEPVKKTLDQKILKQKIIRSKYNKPTEVEEGTVSAPMAGKILSVKVKKGDLVKLGDVVCTLEAMKMENEITATKTGKVKEIRVSEGTSVNERDTLMIIN